MPVHVRRLRRLAPLLGQTRQHATAGDVQQQQQNFKATIGLVLCSQAGGGPCPGYTLFTKSRSTFLIDNAGELVHEWKTDREAFVGYLRDDGHLLRLGFAPRYTGEGQPRDETKWNEKWSMGGGSGYLQEWSWDGELLWEFPYVNFVHQCHHDIELLPNGNILMIAWDRKTFEEAVAAGRDPATLPADELWNDEIIEVAPDGNGGGEIVWRWSFWEHLIQDHDESKPHYGKISEHPRRMNINVGAVNPFAFGQADWMHTNSIAYNAELDQIMISSNFQSEIYIIDHSLTTEEAAGPAGDLLYRWGNPANYGCGGQSDRQLGGQHNAHWIPDGVPGAGNILVFNNNANTAVAADMNDLQQWTTVDEIELPCPCKHSRRDALGRSHCTYTYPLDSQLPAGRFLPMEATWRFAMNGFHSGFISGAQRLPNGNTLCCHGAHGTFFEVTSRGEVVWAYVNPIVGSDTSPLRQGEWPPEGFGPPPPTSETTEGQEEGDGEAEEQGSDSCDKKNCESIGEKRMVPAVLKSLLTAREHAQQALDAIDEAVYVVLPRLHWYVLYY